MKTPTTKNYFITVEGIEGAGKSTAINYIRQLFTSQNVPHVFTREPGGTEIAEDIRKIFLTQHHEAMCENTELLLMFAGRAQHLAQVIKPALAEGKTVLCDRFTDATYAYQGGGRGIPAERIAIIENWVQAGAQPDLILLLDVPVDIGLNRIKKRSNHDRIEREQIQFFNRVRAAYLQRAVQDPKRYKIIDASQSLAQVQKQLQDVLSAYI